LPELQFLADQVDDVELVTVVMNGNSQRVRAVVARLGVDAPTLFADGELARQFRVTAVPWTVIIGRDGRTHKVMRGAYDLAAFRQVVDELL
jgi:hypothetical protein